jgi:hypothetical protein
MAKRSKRGGESQSGYFRRVFQEHPEWLFEKSNNEVLARYRADHNIPDSQDVAKNVRNNLANLKSVLRKQAKGKGGRRGRPPGWGKAFSLSAGGKRLELLEDQIDECLTLARTIDRTLLESVIRHLRSARNNVVWLTGQP